MDSLDKAVDIFENLDLDKFNLGTGAASQDTDYARLRQYQILTKIKLGETTGIREFEELITEIEANSNSRPGDKFLLLSGCYAMLGRVDESISSLKKALDLGINDYVEFSTYDLFDPIRDNADFQKLYNASKTKNERMRANVLKKGGLKKADSQ